MIGKLTVSSLVVMLASACSFTDPMPRRSEPGAHVPADASTQTTSPSPVAEDGGAVCTPTKANLEPIPWAPPAPLHVAACSAPQVDFIAQSMVAPYDDAAVNAAWEKFWADPVNDTCLRCAVSDAATSPRGPIYVASFKDGEYWGVSHEGCVAAIANDGGACGAKLFNLAQCSDEMCGHCSQEGLESCLAAADATSCAPYVDALECMRPYETQCYGTENDDYVDVVKNVLRLFCTRG